MSRELLVEFLAPSHPSHPPSQERALAESVKAGCPKIITFLSHGDTPNRPSHWIIGSETTSWWPWWAFNHWSTILRKNGNGSLGYPKAIFNTRNSRMVDDDLFSAAESRVGFHKKQWHRDTPNFHWINRISWRNKSSLGSATSPPAGESTACLGARGDESRWLELGRPCVFQENPLPPLPSGNLTVCELEHGHL